MRLFQALHEAGTLLLLATALGFIYTASTEKGLFARRLPASPSWPVGSQAPAMISREEAALLFTTGTAVFIDARHEFDYKLGHIRGAVNIPMRMYETRKAALDSIPKDRIVVAYCDGAECNSSIELSVKLMKDGFNNVKIFFGGWREWSEGHLPIEKKQ